MVYFKALSLNVPRETEENHVGFTQDIPSLGPDSSLGTAEYEALQCDIRPVVDFSPSAVK
jgi:hypothetical protein